MYSMVLMMALTTGGDTPAIGHRGGGCGGGCMGSCGGGGGHSRSHRSSRHGGGCCGCQGGYAGCQGGYAGCYGGGMGGCYGGGVVYGGGCCGTVVQSGCHGGGMGMSMSGQIIIRMQGADTGKGKKAEQLKTKPKTKDGGETMAPAPATILVDLPADAKLLIDNVATTSTGASRVFVSPVLNPGRDYHYTLKAEIVRDGQSVKIEKVVAVRAGEATSASLPLPPAGVAQH